MGDLSPGTLPVMKPAEERLDSWKEIAAYLHRDVTTVQRWEKREGMPVHRHLHDRMGSVYAFSSELDAWSQGRRQRLDEIEDAPKAGAAAGCGSGPPTEPNTGGAYMAGDGWGGDPRPAHCHRPQEPESLGRALKSGPWQCCP